MSASAPMFSAADLDRLRASLARDREKAAERRAALARDFEAIVASADGSNTDDEHDPEGQTIGFERAQVWALLAETTARMVELDRAQTRLRDGTFGRCGLCGAPVALDRLLAAPATTTCIDCAISAERVRRRTPGGRG